MSLLKIVSFSGEFPVTPPHLLPGNAGQLARNLKLTHGDLRPLNAAGTVVGTTNGPVRGLFTSDGINFFTWTTPVQAYLAPTIADSFNRVFYTEQAGGLKVTRTTYALTTGGNPSTSYIAGVPTPSAAPTVALSDVTNWPDDAAATLVFTCFYELNGQKYNETTITTTTVTKWRKYTIAAGSIPAAPSSGGTLCFSVSLQTGGVSKWTAYSQGSAFTRTITAFPGGVELQSALASSTYTLTLDWGIAETRTYVFTAVNNFNEESAPSNAVAVDQQYIQRATITGTYSMAGGYVPLQGVNYYRTGIGVSTYFLVNGTPTTAGVGYVDISAPGASSPNTDTVLPSLGWAVPPTGMKNLTMCSNGFYAGSVGRDVYFCEPYHAHAWPYALTLPYGVVGMRWADNALIVTTTAYPYIITGVHPSGMSERRLEVIQAGLSNESMCVVNDGVVYASNDGLVAVRGGRASLTDSQAFWARDDWRSAYAASFSKMTLLSHDGYVCGVFEDREGFYIQLDEKAGELSRLTQQAYGAFIFPQTDLAYLGLAAGVGGFNGGSALTWEWQSKDFVSPAPDNYSVAQVVCTGSVTVKAYADGVQRFSKALTAGVNTFRINPGLRARRWSFYATGTGGITEVRMASSVVELKGG